MRFWDSSGIVPLLVEEASSASMRAHLRADGDLVVWWATPVECVSALALITRILRRATGQPLCGLMRCTAPVHAR